MLRGFLSHQAVSQPQRTQSVLSAILKLVLVSGNIECAEEIMLQTTCQFRLRDLFDHSLRDISRFAPHIASQLINLILRYNASQRLTLQLTTRGRLELLVLAIRADDLSAYHKLCDMFGTRGGVMFDRLRCKLDLMSIDVEHCVGTKPLTIDDPEQFINSIASLAFVFRSGILAHYFISQMYATQRMPYFLVAVIFNDIESVREFLRLGCSPFYRVDKSELKSDKWPNGATLNELASSNEVRDLLKTSLQTVIDDLRTLRLTELNRTEHKDD
jgi:hypothetical protein